MIKNKKIVWTLRGCLWYWSLWWFVHRNVFCNLKIHLTEASKRCFCVLSKTLTLKMFKQVKMKTAKLREQKTWHGCFELQDEPHCFSLSTIWSRFIFGHIHLCFCATNCVFACRPNTSRLQIKGICRILDLSCDWLLYLTGALSCFSILSRLCFRLTPGNL